MLAEYARFVQQIFPSIKPDAARQLLSAAGVVGFCDQDYFATQLGDLLCQGDVVEGLRWIYENEDGTYGRMLAPGMLLSHSCDVDTSAQILFARCAPFDARDRKAREIARQEVYDLYYLPPHGRRGAWLADLGFVQSMRTERILSGIRDGSLLRIDSLSPLGYYHFISKLAVHFLRPQSREEIRLPSAPAAMQRIRYAASAAVGLARYAIVGRST